MWSNFGPALLARLPMQSLNGSTKLSPRWTDVAIALARFRNEYTENDWDGQGAIAIHEDLIDSVTHLAEFLQARGVAAPNWTLPWFDGFILFEWNLEDGSRIGVELTAPNVGEISISSLSGHETLEVPSEGAAAV